jgi:hypothetical protein
MPPIEIDEAEYNRLKGVADLAAAIHANPDGRKLLEQAHRTINPRAPTPTLEQEARFAQPLQELQKQVADVAKLVTDRFDKDESEKKLDAIRRQQDEAFERLVTNSGYRPEGIEAVKKIMTEKGILDVEVAASYFERINPPSAPITPTGSNSFNFVEAFNDESDKALKQLLDSRGDSEAALNKLVGEALNDVRKTSARR